MKEEGLGPFDDSLQGRIEELWRRASKDSLTGLLNRETLEQHIRRRIDEMAPGDPCALIIIDLDDFKRVNDTFGHKAGDQVIHRAGQMLSSLFRASDIVGRLGGDEFAVFLSGSEVDEELMRRKGAEICDELQIVLGDGPAMSLTASAGIYLSEGPQDFDGLYQAADLALYKAKKDGKHRWCIKARGSYKNSTGLAVGAIGMTELLEDLDCGIAIMELSEPIRLVFISPSFCRMLGAAKTEMSTPLDMTCLVHPDDEVEFERIFYGVSAGGKTAQMTLRIASADGRGWLWWRLSGVPLPQEGDYPMVLVSASDVSAFKENQERLEAGRQMMESAFRQTGQSLWEVDMASHRLRFHKPGSLFYEGEPVDGIDFPDGLVESGFVHPSAVARFREFASGLLTGQSEGYGSFITRLPGCSGYGWVALSYIMIFDKAGAAVRAVGVASDLSDTFKGQSTGIIPQPLLPQALLADLMVRMRLNLSQDSVDDLWLEGRSLAGRLDDASASTLLGGKLGKIFNSDDRKALGQLFDREHLLNLHAAGHDWVNVWYERADSGGNIRHVRHVFHLLEGSLTHDVYLNSYLIRVSLPASWHGALRNGEHDAETGIWSRNAVEAAAAAAFSGQEDPPSVAVLQVSGPESMRSGSILTALSSALGVALGGSCLIGTLSPDQLVILFPAGLNRQALRRRLEEALVYVRRVVDGLPARARLIAGVAMPAAGVSYSSLLSAACAVCSLWWNASGDTIAFQDENDDRSWISAQNQEEGDSIMVMSHDLARPLSDGEKDVAINCMGAMLAADSLEASVLGVLRTIGIYYQADRVYLLMLSAGDRVVTMPYEWTRVGKNPIQQVVSGMKLDRFPILIRCLSEKSPVLLRRQRRDTGVPWCFTAVPLIRKGNADAEGFLCIENPAEHTGNAVLFGALIPYMLHERDRFQGSAGQGGAVEKLMGLPDLRSYMSRIRTLNSGSYSSLGAVCLDIPSMASINGRQGFEYGSRLLWYVSKTLMDIFGQDLVFRTWEAEFVAFLPDTTGQVFQGRCMRLRSILQRRYPGETRVGTAWSDGVFTGRQLVEDARGTMDKGANTSGNGLSYRDDLSMADDPPVHITLHYQPKIDLGSGQLVGCEALVRAVSEDGTLVPPARFIPRLEEQGSIREMDLYVLEMALCQAETWIKSGLPAVPVAVNISRVTLSHPSAMASILAAQSRHPLVPQDALEVEVTESAGVMDNAEFRNAVDRFREAGLHVGLDDFGSRYANMSLFTDVVFDTVKLDRSLISGIVGNQVNRMLVRDLVSICRSRGMDCVAEGVETEEQRAALLETGCMTAQGYLFDRPLPCEVFEKKYLRKNDKEESYEKQY